MEWICHIKIALKSPMQERAYPPHIFGDTLWITMLRQQRSGGAVGGWGSGGHSLVKQTTACRRSQVLCVRRRGESVGLF
jgi:hypothetical protein